MGVAAPWAAGAAVLFAGFWAIAGIRPCLVIGGGMARRSEPMSRGGAVIQHCRLHFGEAALGERLGRASCGYFARIKNGLRQQPAIFRPRGTAVSPLWAPRKTRADRTSVVYGQSE